VGIQSAGARGNSDFFCPGFAQFIIGKDALKRFSQGPKIETRPRAFVCMQMRRESRTVSNHSAKIKVEA
jgi:hypothetical protein